MNGIIPSLSSCSMCENLFWETRGKLRFVISSFYLWRTQWQNTFWTWLALPHKLCFCFWGFHTRSKPALPGRSASRDTDLLCCWSLQSGHLHEHQPSHLDGGYSENRKEIHMECRSGTIFLKWTPALTIKLWSTNKTPVSTLFISCKTDSPGQWQGNESFIKEMRQLSFSPWLCCFLVPTVAFLVSDKGSVNYTSLGPGCWWFTDCTSLPAPPHLLLWN